MYNAILSGDIRRAVPPTINIENMGGCILDVRRAALDSESGPAEPEDYVALRRRLEPCREKVPSLYCDNVFDPYARTLDKIGEAGFKWILREDPTREYDAGLMFDIAQAILQNGEGYLNRATVAFQEVISDLYDGFLSEADRRGVKQPDYSVIAPLVKWGNPEFGPYTWPGGSTASFGLKTGIVNLPPANASHGLMAWSALAHETAGHDILSADKGLSLELSEALWKALQESGLPEILPGYWAGRLDEAASDVMGIMNMGPAAGIGLVAFFRGLSAAYSNNGRGVLRRYGALSDPHPADILRGYLAASAVRRLAFGGAETWAKVIEAETDRDLTTIRLGETVIDAGDAKRSAEVAAETVMHSKMAALENHSLIDIRDWTDWDDQIVSGLRPILRTACQCPDVFVRGFYAAHVVAAAVIEALSGGADIPVIIDRMQAMLKLMHDHNSSWGPLGVAHPGDISSVRAYIPQYE